MRDEYMRRIDTIEHQRRKQKGDKLAGVIKMWEDRVRWWNTEFKYEKDFKYAAGGEKSERGGVAGGRAYGARKSAKGAKKPASAGSDSTMREEARPAEAPAPRPEAKAAEPAPAAASPSAPGMMPARREAEAAPLDANVRLLDQSMRPLGGFVPEVYDAAGRRKAASKPSSRQPGIVIKPWEPDTPYLKELRAAKADDRFAVYMKNRAGYGNSPAFFLDCADFFREQGLPELALQVLSNVAELQLEDASLLRVLGYRLLQLGYLDLAAQTFQQVLDLRPEEPQSYRDLALTLARRAEKTAAERNAPSGAQPGQGEGLREIDESVRADYSRAIDLWIQIVLKRWDNRFPEIELIALEELNHVVPKAKAAGVSDIPLDPRLIRLLDVDIRIVMTWHADATDIDLWVTEPSGEKAFYSHNRTTIGGLVSRDFTGGYGPEEYMVRRAANGMYKIEANYYGSRATRLIGAVTVQVDVFTNFGRPTESHKSLTVRLKEAKETVLIGQIEF
jgi:tetratricopeptide (TPR) repeat protein